MGSEPTLYEGDLDVGGWVDTLQLALRRAGQDVGVDGKFGSGTRAAVQAFQHAAGIERDGVVGNQTWAALMGRDPEPPGVNNGPHGGLHPRATAAATPAPTPAPAAPPATDTAHPYAGTPWESIWDHGYETGKADPNGVFDAPPMYDADSAKVWLAGVAAGQEAARSGGAAQQPGTGQQPSGTGKQRSDGPTVTDGQSAPGPVTGLSALRVNVPNIQLAGITLDTPTAYLIITAGLQGSGTITVDPPPGPLAISVDENGYRAEIRSQMEGLFSGIRISGLTGGIAGGTMSLGTTWGNEFVSSEVRMISPTQYRFLGQANLSGIELPTSAGPAQLTGAFGFYIDMEVHPKPPPIPVEEPEPEHWYERAWDWVGDHAGEIVVGVVVIGVIVVVPEAAPGVLRLVPG